MVLAGSFITVRDTAFTSAYYQHPAFHVLLAFFGMIMTITHDHEQSTYLVPYRDLPFQFAIGCERIEMGGGACTRVAAEAMCCGTQKLR
jgi:hypothetical protein